MFSSLDNSLETTHPPMRIWLIVARFCALAVWQDDKKNIMSRLQEQGLTFRLFKDTVSAWWTYKMFDWSLWIAEFGADRWATWKKVKIYFDRNFSAQNYEKNLNVDSSSEDKTLITT